MKKLLSMLAAFALVLTLAGCGSKEEASTKELVISTWGLSADAIRESVYAPFEEANDCKIVVEHGGTAERYNKFVNNPNNGIDIIELSQAEAQKGFAKDLFLDMDYSKVPNVNDLIEPAKKLADAKNNGIPFVINSLVIVYDKSQIDFEIKDWSDLWDARLKNKISIPEITTTFGPAMVHIAGDVAGTPVASDNGVAAFEKLAELKPNIVKTFTKTSDLANMFNAGEIAVAVVADFGFPIISGVSDSIDFLVPASGTYANFNTFQINKNSENAELAYKFMNWRLDAELEKTNARGALNESPVNKNCILSEEEAMNKTYGDVAANAKVIDYTVVNPLMPEWIDKWNRTLNN